MAKQIDTQEEKAAKAAEKEVADNSAVENDAAARGASDKSTAEKEAVEKADRKVTEKNARETAEKDVREADEKIATEKADRKAAEPKAGGKFRLEKEGERILAEYPDAPEVFMTTNGFGFFRETDARNHAAALRDKTVTTVKRK